VINIPTRRIYLSSLGYESPNLKKIYGTVSLTFQDFSPRLVFIDDKIFAVSVNHVIKGANPEVRIGMEAFFVSKESGMLVARKSWQARERRGLNDFLDTQTRILPLKVGFLVHSGDSLYLYSPDLEVKRELPFSSRINMDVSGFSTWRRDQGRAD
jgi:hypothetical protein